MNLVNNNDIQEPPISCGDRFLTRLLLLTSLALLTYCCVESYGCLFEQECFMSENFLLINIAPLSLRILVKLVETCDNGDDSDDDADAEIASVESEVILQLKNLEDRSKRQLCWTEST